MSAQKNRVFIVSIAFRMWIRIACLTCLLMIMQGCKKTDIVEVSGKMYDPNQEVPIEGVRVELWTQSIESGIYSANFSHMGTELSGADGNFLFDVENKNWAAMRIHFSKENYYSWEHNVNMEDIKNLHSSHLVYQMLPKAWIKFHIQNTQSVDQNDYFEFRLMNGYTGCEECCHGEKYQFSGISVDQTIICQVTGHMEIMIQWSKRKDGEQRYQTDTYFVSAFDTTSIHFMY